MHKLEAKCLICGSYSWCGRPCIHRPKTDEVAEPVTWSKKAKRKGKGVTKKRDAPPAALSNVTKDRDRPATGERCPCCGQIVKAAPMSAAERKRKSRARKKA